MSFRSFCGSLIRRLPYFIIVVFAFNVEADKKYRAKYTIVL